MRDLTLFATAEHPLHASGLRGLLECPWRAVHLFLMQPDGDEGGPAADTGSAVHVAVAAHHRGSTAAEALEAAKAGMGRYPRADIADAACIFLAYAADPRNTCPVVLVEQPIAFSIQPAPDDPTQAPIEVVGTLDQVREIDGKLMLWDIKTTKKDPPDMMHEYAMQLAAYLVGGSIFLGRPIDSAGCIFPRKYKRPFDQATVFWHYTWKLVDCAAILEGVRHQVAAIRRGYVWHRPGSGCFWCHQRSPDLCLPEMHRLGVAAK